MIDERIISRIKCTYCGASMWEFHKLDEENGILVCIKCNAAYPVIDGAIYLTPSLYRKTVSLFIEQNISRLKEKEIQLLKSTMDRR